MNTYNKELTDCITQGGYKIKIPDKKFKLNKSYEEQGLRMLKIQEQSKQIREYLELIKTLNSRNSELRNQNYLYERKFLKFEGLEKSIKTYDEDLKARFMKEKVLQNHIDDLTKQIENEEINYKMKIAEYDQSVQDLRQLK